MYLLKKRTPMITSTNLSMLRNLEYFQIMSNVLAYLKEEDLEKLKLAAFADDFEKQVKKLDEVLVLERGHVLSAKLGEVDKKRDNALHSLTAIINAYTVFPEEAKSDAALQLKHLIEKYGKNIERLPYLQESGVLSNLLQDLALPENAALLELLHLNEWVVKLKAAAEEFDQLFMGREADNSVKLSGQVKGARQAVQELFQRLAALIQAYEIVYGAEEYVSLSAKINEAVEYARAQVARRSKRKKEGEEESPEA